MSARPHASIAPLLKRITARPFSTTRPAFNEPVAPPTLTGAAALGFKPRAGRTRQLDLSLDIPSTYRNDVSKTPSNNRDSSRPRGPAVDTSSKADFFAGSRPPRAPRREQSREEGSEPRQRAQPRVQLEEGAATASTPGPRRRIESVSLDVVAGEALPTTSRQQGPRPRRTRLGQAPGQGQGEARAQTGGDRQRPGQAPGQRQRPGLSQSQSGPMGQRRPGQPTGPRTGPYQPRRAGARPRRNGPGGGRRGGDKERDKPVILRKTVSLKEYKSTVEGAFGSETLLGQRRARVVRTQHYTKGVFNDLQNRQQTAVPRPPRLPTDPVTPEDAASRAAIVARWAGIVNPGVGRKGRVQLNDTVMRLLDLKKQSA
ncbi:hypothetical protein IAT38_002823 [Cryptococcus sp. DSM 104549]